MYSVKPEKRAGGSVVVRRSGRVEFQVLHRAGRQERHRRKHGPAKMSSGNPVAGGDRPPGSTAGTATGGTTDDSPDDPQRRMDPARGEGTPCLFGTITPRTRL